ncbi:hypothetical protein AWW68_13615 [Roseivirga spongicola]|uniref:Cyclic nucleotide-binding domain-containing protein n=2 Tax=Roseivirga spongicola TaxID=333140 RepID=A0A150X6H0_9BACT|nr:hypothetical protein AWW68_13615 [Roseivirga spongicola]
MLTPQEVDTIVDGTNIQAFPKGTILLKEGQISDKCYFVLKGLIREYYLKDGDEKTTAFFTENEPVNSFTSNNSKSPSRSYLECIEDCILTVGTDDIIEAMCKKVPRLENLMRVEVEKNAGKFQDEYAAFIMSSPEERYVSLLEKRPGLMNRVPQHQIASFLGVKPESLSRIRKRLLTAK